MSEWLQTYNDFFGMYHAGIITSIFGAFAVTFTVLMSWPKLVKDFGPIGGFMAAALIIGTFWVVNHKLPGFGFSTGLLNDADGLPMQFCLIHQGNRGSAPWVDMGWAIAMGFILADVLCAPKGTRGGLLKEAFPRWLNCVKYCVYIQIDYFLKMLWIAIYRHHTVRYTRIIYKNINLSVFPVNCLDFVCHFFCVCQTRAGTGYFPFRIFFL